MRSTFAIFVLTANIACLGIARTSFGSALDFRYICPIGGYRMRLGKANRANPFALRSTFAIFVLSADIASASLPIKGQEYGWDSRPKFHAP